MTMHQSVGGRFVRQKRLTLESIRPPHRALLMKKFRIVAALWSLLVMPLAVLGQEPILERRPLTFEALETLGHDNNLMRLSPEAVVPASLNGRASSYSRTRGFISYDDTWSLQRFRASASAEALRYDKLSVFDHQAAQIDARWDWSIGRPWFGTLEIGAQRFLSPFTEVRPFSGSRVILNMIDRSNVRFSAGIHVTPDWSGVVGMDRVDRNNSDPSRTSTNLVERGFDAGLRWTPIPDLESELRWRRIDGEYSNRVVFDLFGDLIPGLVADNAYTQDEFTVRAVHDDGGQSRSEGSVGWVRRAFPNLTGRDFSAPVIRLRYTWRPTVKLSMPIGISREFYSVEQLTSTFSDTERITLAPTWEINVKSRLILQLERQLRTFRGNVGAALGISAGGLNPNEIRNDAVNVLGLRLNHEFTRNWFVDADFRSEHRHANLAVFRFDARVLFVSLRFVL